MMVATRPAPSATDKFELSAVVASARVVALVTLNWTGKSLRLVPNATCMLELEDSDVLTVQSAADHIERYLLERKIHHLVIYRGAYSGKQRAARSNLLLETALELSSLSVVRVQTSGVMGWTAHRDWLLPLPQPDLSPRQREVQLRAIKTAGYAASRVLVERVRTAAKWSEMDSRSPMEWAA